MHHIHNEVPWCMLFTTEVVVIDETPDIVNTRLEVSFGDGLWSPKGSG